MSTDARPVVVHFDLDFVALVRIACAKAEGSLATSFHFHFVTLVGITSAETKRSLAAGFELGLVTLVRVTGTEAERCLATRFNCTGRERHGEFKQTATHARKRERRRGQQ